MAGWHSCWFSSLFVAKGHTSGLVRWPARGQVAVNGIPNRLNYCIIFYSTDIIYKCGRGPPNTKWRTAGLGLEIHGVADVAITLLDGLLPIRGKRFFSSPKRPDRLWGPPCVPFGGW